MINVLSKIISIETCYRYDVDTEGGSLLDGKWYHGIAALEFCQKLCFLRADCTHFTYKRSTRECWLKHRSTMKTTKTKGLISGTKGCE